jgi:hypothetical protein
MKMQEHKNPNKKSLSSKFREFWILHPNVLVIIVCTIFLVLAIAILCVVGAYRGWDVHTLLVSPNAILVYVLAGLVAIVYIFQRIIFKRW